MRFFYRVALSVDHSETTWPCMFDFNLDGILAGAQWAAATTQLFYGHIEAVVFLCYFIVKLLRKIASNAAPWCTFFVPTTILSYVANNNQQLWTCTYGKQNCFFIFCTKISLHGLPSIINLTHGTFVFRGSKKGALVIYVLGIHGKNRYFIASFDY